MITILIGPGDMDIAREKENIAIRRDILILITAFIEGLTDGIHMPLTCGTAILNYPSGYYEYQLLMAATRGHWVV
jgi:hypothetical protein